MRWRLACVLALALVALAVPASAQRTGGSFGGSRGFGGSSSSSSSSRSSSWSGSSGSSSRSSDFSWGRSRRSRRSTRSTPPEPSSSSSSSSAPNLPVGPPPPVPEEAHPPFPLPRAVATDSVLQGADAPFDQRPPEEQSPRPTLARVVVPRRPQDPTEPWIVGGIVGLLAFVLAVAFRRTNRARRSASTEPRTAVPLLAPCEIRRVTLAFDWDARAELQARLAAIAGEHDFTSADGMKAGAAVTVQTLTSHLADARYGIYERERATPAGAEAAFAKRTVDLRARFQEELVRGTEEREGSEIRARADEGEGLVAVSVVVGSMVAMRPLAPTPTREALGAALTDLVGLTSDQLVAFEVIWSPAKDEDRMSSHELERVYPELLRLDDDAGLGSVQCRYCMAPHPAELGRCPACGAPH